jgi:D-alanyl-D-alanine carboxypeptidase (penicillin-binding protein 5/6)
MKNADFREIVKTFSYDMQATNKQSARTVENTNVLLDPENENYYQYATGIKTGSTPKAGGCIVSSASKNGMNLICLVYGEKPSEGTYERWKVSKALYEWGFETYKTIDVTPLLETAEPLQAQVENYAADDTGSGLLEFKKPEAGTTFVTLEAATAEGLISGTDKLIATPTYNSEPLQAPIKKDDVLGTVVYTSEATSEEVYRCDLIASRDVNEAGTTSGETAVTTLPPTPPAKDPGQSSGAVWYWLIVPFALIAFLVVRLVTTRRSKRFRKRKPHYSYRIK